MGNARDRKSSNPRRARKAARQRSLRCQRHVNQLQTHRDGSAGRAWHGGIGPSTRGLDFAANTTNTVGRSQRSSAGLGWRVVATTMLFIQFCYGSAERSGVESKGQSGLSVSVIDEPNRGLDILRPVSMDLDSRYSTYYGLQATDKSGSPSREERLQTLDVQSMETGSSTPQAMDVLGTKTGSSTPQPLQQTIQREARHDKNARPVPFFVDPPDAIARAGRDDSPNDESPSNLPISTPGTQLPNLTMSLSTPVSRGLPVQASRPRPALSVRFTARLAREEMGLVPASQPACCTPVAAASFVQQVAVTAEVRADQISARRSQASAGQQTRVGTDSSCTVETEVHFLPSFGGSQKRVQRFAGLLAAGGGADGVMWSAMPSQCTVSIDTLTILQGALLVERVQIHRTEPPAVSTQRDSTGDPPSLPPHQSHESVEPLSVPPEPAPNIPSPQLEGTPSPSNLPHGRGGHTHPQAEHVQQASSSAASQLLYQPISGSTMAGASLPLHMRVPAQAMPPSFESSPVDKMPQTTAGEPALPGPSVAAAPFRGETEGVSSAGSSQSGIGVGSPIPLLDGSWAKQVEILPAIHHATEPLSRNLQSAVQSLSPVSIAATEVVCAAMSTFEIFQQAGLDDFTGADNSPEECSSVLTLGLIAAEADVMSPTQLKWACVRLSALFPPATPEAAIKEVALTLAQNPTEAFPAMDHSRWRLYVVTSLQFLLPAVRGGNPHGSTCCPGMSSRKGIPPCPTKAATPAAREGGSDATARTTSFPIVDNRKSQGEVEDRDEALQIEETSDTPEERRREEGEESREEERQRKQAEQEKQKPLESNAAAKQNMDSEQSTPKSRSESGRKRNNRDRSSSDTDDDTSSETERDKGRGKRQTAGKTARASEQEGSDDSDDRAVYAQEVAAAFLQLSPVSDDDASDSGSDALRVTRNSDSEGGAGDEAGEKGREATARQEEHGREEEGAGGEEDKSQDEEREEEDRSPDEDESADEGDDDSDSDDADLKNDGKDGDKSGRNGVGKPSEAASAAGVTYPIFAKGLIRAGPTPRSSQFQRTDNPPKLGRQDDDRLREETAGISGLEGALLAVSNGRSSLARVAQPPEGADGEKPREPQPKEKPREPRPVQSPQEPQPTENPEESQPRESPQEQRQTKPDILVPSDTNQVDGSAASTRLASNSSAAAKSVQQSGERLPGSLALGDLPFGSVGLELETPDAGPAPDSPAGMPPAMHADLDMEQSIPAFMNDSTPFSLEARAEVQASGSSAQVSSQSSSRGLSTPAVAAILACTAVLVFATLAGGYWYQRRVDFRERDTPVSLPSRAQHPSAVSARSSPGSGKRPVREPSRAISQKSISHRSGPPQWKNSGRQKEIPAEMAAHLAENTTARRCTTASGQPPEDTWSLGMLRHGCVSGSPTGCGTPGRQLSPRPAHDEMDGAAMERKRADLLCFGMLEDDDHDAIDMFVSQLWQGDSEFPQQEDVAACTSGEHWPTGNGGDDPMLWEQSAGTCSADGHTYGLYRSTSSLQSGPCFDSTAFSNTPVPTTGLLSHSSSIGRSEVGLSPAFLDPTDTVMTGDGDIVESRDIMTLFPSYT